MNDKSKRVPWHPSIPIVVQLTHTLYAIDECECGGLAHVVLDDGNISVKDLMFTINLCDEPPEWAADRPERHLVKCIMEYMREITIEQRYLAFQFAEDMNEYVLNAIDYDENMWNQWYDMYEDRINEMILPDLREYCKMMGCLDELEET